MTRHLILGTAGHVDHGKTALIKALTDFDCDTHKEEKTRGITINLGFTHLDLPSGDSVGIVDVPGHKDFIKTMVAGVFGIDIVLLVVAADSGIMPQTIEHLKIIELLGIEKGIIVLTKVDLVDNEMLELAELEVAELIEKTKLKNAPIVKVSSTTGIGLESLITAISTIGKPKNQLNNLGPFRMYIDRIFNIKGIGAVVTGSVLDGKIATGKNLFLLPGNKKSLKVRDIERHGKSVESVIRGDRAALNLTGLKLEDFQRGMVLAEKIIEETHLIDATFTLFSEDYNIGIWSKVIIFSGTFECSSKMHLLDTDSLVSNESGIVQLHLEKPSILLTGDKFIVRNSSNDKTIGGGMIVDENPLHHRKRTTQLIEDLKELAETISNSENLINRIKIELKKENNPVFLEKISDKLGLDPTTTWKECIENSKSSILTFIADGFQVIVSNDVYQDLRNSIIFIIKEYHKKNPIVKTGMETKQFYGKFGYSGNEPGKLLLNHIMNDLEQENRIIKEENTWVISNHQVRIDPKVRDQLDWLEKTLISYKTQVPNIKNIESEALSKKISKDQLKMLFHYLTSNKMVYFYEGDYVHSVILSEVKNQLLDELRKKENGINEKEFRLLMDCSKSFVQVVLNILISEEFITKKTFYIHITEKGKNYIGD